MKMVLFILMFVQAGHADVCDFYLQKSQELNCGTENYLVQFGYRYCAEFERTQNQYTGPGIETLSRLRTCLIEDLRANGSLTCANAKPTAQESHVRCYLENGFCELPSSDKWRILGVVWRELFDPSFANVVWRIENSCNWRLNMRHER